MAASAEQRGFVAGFQGLRRRYAGRLACGQPGTDDAGGHAEQHVDGRYLGLEMQRWPQSGKVSGAEVAAENGEQSPRQRVTERRTDHAADESDQSALADEPDEQAAAGEADGAEKGKLAAPAHDRERLRREDEEAAGEQRHRRQHRQIDPVGARQVAGLVLRFGGGLDNDAGGQHGL
mgnify:CR=1 FL=1